MSGEQIAILILVIVVGWALGQGALILFHRLGARREQKRREDRRKKEDSS